MTNSVTYPFQIVRHILKPDSDDVLLGIKERDQTEVKYYSATHVYYNDIFYKLLSPDDIRLVAFYVYQKEFRQEQASINALK